MVLQHVRNLKEEIKKIVRDLIRSEVNNSDIFVVTGVNTDLTCNVKKLNINLQYDNVEILGLGKGHLKGQILMPEIGDIVYITFINNRIPIILGSLFNNYTSEVDSKIQIRKGEYFVTNKANGGYILIDEDDTMKIVASSGAKIKLNKDGSFKIFNQSNYGIECDTTGNITFRDQSGTTTTTSTPGTW